MIKIMKINKRYRTLFILLVFVLWFSVINVSAQEPSYEALLEQVKQLKQENTILHQKLDSYEQGKKPQEKAVLSEFQGLFTEEDVDQEDALLQELMGDFGEFETQQSQKEKDLSDEEYSFLELGVEEDYMKMERFRLKDQILTFIPPLYQPAFVGHAYVLPPGVARAALSYTSLRVGSDDFFKDHRIDYSTHENHKIINDTVNFDLFYGLDHDMTLRLNIPYRLPASNGSVHPNAQAALDFFVEGDAAEIGDVSLFLKKKWWDQANYPFGFATVGGVLFPTGAHDKKFNFPVSSATGLCCMGTGIFDRFTADGELPAGLQPGTGGFGGHVGAFVTRQFTRPRGAFHTGALATFLEGDDNVKPGNRIKFFASYVKPIYKDYLSLEGAINGMWKEDDSYGGFFSPPGSAGPMQRPAFQGGTVFFYSPSLIFNPTPNVRIHFSASFRGNEPRLGPWPGEIYQLGLTTTF